MYGCESWTVKKAESRRIDAFELWCWSRLLRVPWTARRSNQSILKASPNLCVIRSLTVSQLVTAAMKLKDACSLEESYDPLRQHIKKQRHHFADKVPIFKAMVFPVVMYRCESWTIKKTECQRIDAFKLWYWRRLLRVP